MKLHIFLATILFFLSSCATEQRGLLPPLSPAPETKNLARCATVFPKGKWQFIHAIDFTMGSGGTSAVIGVTSLNGDHIDCALVTVEGLTLFEATWVEKDGLKIQRAIPPFDNPRFAAGLMRDLRAIFSPPAADHVETGQISGSGPICRYTDDDGKVVDLLPETDDCWRINIYGADLTLDRSITGRSCRVQSGSRIPDHLELNSYGQNGYSLKMTLIRADNS